MDQRFVESIGMGRAAMPEGVLDRPLRNDLADALNEVPTAATFAGRTALLDGLPHNIEVGLDRSENNRFTDITNLIDQLEQLGRLKNGERPVVIVAHNAWRLTRGTELGTRLEQLRTEIEKRYSSEPPLTELPDRPEVLIFGGDGEWVEGLFMEQAQLAGRQVARLAVQRFFDAQRSGGVGYGTGWLVAANLMLTNYHVIEARDFEKNEEPAAKADFDLQAKHTAIWFDYHSEGKIPLAAAAAAAVTGVAASSQNLDYALLRLQDAPDLRARHRMTIASKPSLEQGARLNIVQCPDGGPLRYAIRNNFFVGPGDRPHQIRYLTDTKAGSSGSPVLNDNWNVVAMHRGYKEVNPAAYGGLDGARQIVKFHNEGIDIGHILADLPQQVRTEIETAQKSIQP
jgi:endonuclease G